MNWLGQRPRARDLLHLGEREQATSEGREAVAILKAEVARTKRADLRSVLSWALEALRDVLDRSPLPGPEQATSSRTIESAWDLNAGLSVGAIDTYFASSSDIRVSDEGELEIDSRPLHVGRSETLTQRSEIQEVTQVVIDLAFRSE